MKVEGESEILASLVAVKLYSIAELICKKMKRKKTKVKVATVTKKDEKCQTSNTHYSVSWAEAAMKNLSATTAQLTEKMILRHIA